MSEKEREEIISKEYFNREELQGKTLSVNQLLLQNIVCIAAIKYSVCCCCCRSANEFPFKLRTNFLLPKSTQCRGVHTQFIMESDFALLSTFD